MEGHRRGHRWLPVGLVVATALTACSGDDSQGGTTAAPSPSSTIVDGAAAGDVPVSTAPDASAATDADSGAAEPRTVRIDVVAGELETSIAVDVEPDADPFARFASCSAYHSVVGPYSVLAADPAAVVMSVGVATSERVDGPGTYDADVRVEPLTGPAVVGVGTMTIDADLTSGSFLAFTAAGDEIDGEFDCVGGAPPEPLEAGDAADDELETVEVVALVRRGGAERVLGSAVTAASAPTAQCPGAAGERGPPLVELVGGDSVGSITGFELTGAPDASLQMQVGGVDYDTDDVEVDVDDSATTGTFSATSGEVMIEGAFRCT